MGAHRISDYSLPTLAEVQPNRAAWQLQPRRAALLVHDMQLYFLDFFEHEGRVRRQLIDNVRAICAAARTLDMPVIYTAQPGDMGPRRGLLLDIWGAGMTADPDERGIHPQVLPHPSDTVLTKWRYSAFHESDLTEHLREAGISQLVVVGVFAHVGCLISAVDAFSRDIEVFMPVDATADFDRERHLMAMSYAAANCAVVTDTKSIASMATD